MSVTGGFECKLIFFSRIAIGSVSVYFIRLSLVCHLAVFRETCFELGAMETIPNSRVLIPYSSDRDIEDARGAVAGAPAAQLCADISNVGFFFPTLFLKLIL